MPHELPPFGASRLFRVSPGEVDKQGRGVVQDIMGTFLFMSDRWSEKHVERFLDSLDMKKRVKA